MGGGERGITNSAAPLREELQQIVCGDPANVPRHPELVHALRNAIEHSIRPAAPQLVPPLQLDRYNCFEFALGLAGNRRVHLASLGSTCCDTNFIEYLESVGAISHASEGAGHDLLLYRDAEFKHAGVPYEEAVLSKWGAGHLWTHGFWEVPTSYGTSFAPYKLAHAADPAELFVEFSRGREGSIIDDILERG